MEQQVGEQRALPRTTERKPLPAARTSSGRAGGTPPHRLRSSNAATRTTRPLAPAQGAISGSLAPSHDAARTNAREAQMTRLERAPRKAGGSVAGHELSFVETIDVEEASPEPDEPSPCLPRPPPSGTRSRRRRRQARGRSRRKHAARPVVRLYRRVGSHPPRSSSSAARARSGTRSSRSSYPSTRARRCSPRSAPRSRRRRLVVRAELRGEPGVG